jgi:3D (Asp-Asp-Asp) domain-containing protein
MNLKKTSVVMAIASLLLMIGTSMAVASAQSGCIDGGRGMQIFGWAWDASTPDQPIDVQIVVKKVSDNSIVFHKTITADDYREDLLAKQMGNGLHGFHTTIDWNSMENTEYLIEANAGGVPLYGSLYYKEGTYRSASYLPASVPAGSSLIPLGTYKTTAYCPCRICSSKWGTLTSTGAVATANHTVAVDPRVIPYGSKLLINGVIYTAEDKGGGVKGKHIDIFFNSHKEAKNYGVKKLNVYLVK